ncbi:MAG TPA: hypothetical protein VJ793_22410 [Anaerolineae bacterium]|nr:hypothetical protein [Anaerolineae bacterium]
MKRNHRSLKVILLRLALRLGLFRSRRFALSGERIGHLPDEIVLDLWQRQRPRMRGAR